MHISQKTLNKIAELKDVNDHGTAYQMAAEALGQKDLAARFERINRQHMRDGELSMTLYGERMEALQDMLKFARSHMSDTDYQRFYMLF